MQSQMIDHLADGFAGSSAGAAAPLQDILDRYELILQSCEDIVGMSEEKDETSIASNPRGDLETLCKRKSYLEWPQFTILKQSNDKTVEWTCKATLKVKNLNSFSEWHEETAVSTKKSQAVYQSRFDTLSHQKALCSY